ncbi:MarR family winged helix-turn-helix transcriptional regulator [Camelimonas abortus]|uniref:MarR family winged helix-turn-helix transcriptional regulator n=2 Tax=Camelimonas abortus TaxID=1017184 RepID=A0ABV7LH38_9HYPH
MTRDACLCLHAQRAARALARRFDEAFRPFGLTNSQFSLMMALNQPQPPTIGAVAAVLGADRTTLTAALKPLERRGLVRAAADAKDRRARRLALTAEGQALLARALATWQEAHAALEAALAAAGHDADALRGGLNALAGRNGAPPP